MAKRAILIIFFTIFGIATFYRCFWRLADPPLERWDEITNVSVVTDTLSRGAFPLLYLGGKPFFEKPPLWYWLTGAVGAIAITPFTMRIVSAVSGFCLILLSAYMSYRWWGLIASGVTWIILLFTNHLFVTNPGGFFSTHSFRSADVDALFMLFLLISTFFAAAMPKSKNAAIGSGIFAGLGILTKGPVGALPLLFARKHRVAAWISMAAIVIPWYIGMSVQFGMPFILEHAGYHLTARAVFAIEGHNNPAGYFLTVITNRSVFPSWELALFSLVWILAHRRLRKDAKVQMVVAMAIVLFLIPTLIQTRLAWYILPAYPFLALAIGVAVQDAVKTVIDKSNKRALNT